MSPQAIPPGHPPPRPWRWLVFIGLALLLGAWLAIAVLPRLGGRLPGLNWEKRSGTDWSQVQVVWESGDGPADESTASADEATAEEALEVEAVTRPAADAAAEPPSGTPAPQPAGGSPGVGKTPAAGPSGAAGAPPARGGGPARESPRILQAAWPARALLDKLKGSGRLRYRLRVEPDGRVSAHELIDDGGFDCPPCRREAERIIGELRFAPGTLDGRPVVCWVPYEISFEKGGR